MSDRLPVGPYRTIETETGQAAPWYIIPFDKKGNCTGPLTRDHLLTTAKNNTYTDIILFAHGWNNDWNTATRRYEDFLEGYVKLRRSQQLTYPRPRHPLLVGVFWPSTALVLPWEIGPTIAAERKTDDAAIAQERQEIETLAEALKPEDAKAFYRLVQREKLTRAEALELAHLLFQLYADPSQIGEELPDDSPLASAEELLKLWQRATPTPEDTSGEFGFADEIAEPAGADIASDWLTDLDPRNIIRAATVWQMKDRAGVVGAYGVGSLLRELLTQNSAVRLHLIGHSYGCKVLLSALCFQEPPRPADSLLLLQPAVSYLCFAEDATGSGQPGGYRPALNRVEQPILSTFSRHDVPLTQLFHLAVRRRKDVGEIQIAAATPPNRYAALGGYGPGGCPNDCQEIDMLDVGQAYQLGAGAPQIYALKGDHAIANHGDIINRYTWWALYSQLAH